MLSKQRNLWLIHKRGDLRLYLTEMSPNISSFVKAAKHIQTHPTELGTMICTDLISSNKIL